MAIDEIPDATFAVKPVGGIETIQRKEKVNVSESPDFQPTIEKFAASGNFLGNLGASVAQSASNEMAKQLGYEAGKNPHGSLMPSLTEFDKTFAESYKTQSAATLSIQAEKLLSDAQVEMAKPNRLTPDLIAKTHQQLATGLSKLAEQAPLEVRSQLEKSFTSQILQHTTQYKNRMFQQQRTDQENLIKNGLEINIKNAYEMAASGDFKGAQSEVDAAIRSQRAGLGGAYLTPSEARIARQNAEQARINGMQVHEATKAFREGRFGEWAKTFSEGSHGLTNEQYVAAGQAVSTQINFLKGLQQEENSIQVVKFEQDVALNVNAITPARIAEMKNNVSPLQYEKLQLEYIKAKNSFNKENEGVNNLIAGFGNAETFARGTDSQKNKTFDRLVASHMDSMSKAGTPINQDEAEAQIASSAAGAIPGYVAVLNTKLASANPDDIESAGKSIAYINNRKKGANLHGLNDQATAMYGIYQALRRSKIPQEAADEAYKAVYTPRTEEDKRMIDDGWSENIKTIKKDTGLVRYFTNLGGIDSATLIDPMGYVDQAQSILQANYVLTKGDLETAKKMTADAIKNTYGESFVNGKKETVFYPLEDAVGVPHDAAGYIQADVTDFVGKQVQSLKSAYDAGLSAFYYEVAPRQSAQHAAKEHVYYDREAGTLQVKTDEKEFEKGSGMVIYKHWKNGNRETYPLIIKADPWLSKASNPSHPYTGGWDIVLGTDKSYIPLTLANPMVSQVVVYRPDVQKIKSEYIKNHGLKD